MKLFTLAIAMLIATIAHADPLTHAQRRAMVFDPAYAKSMPASELLPRVGPPTESMSTAWMRFGEDVFGAVGDTVFVDLFFDVVVPTDTIWLSRVILNYDKSIINAVTVEQGVDAAAAAEFPALWLFTTNYVGWLCGDLIFLMDNYQIDQSWQGHAVRIGFEVLSLEEVEIRFCRIEYSGDNQLALLHRGVEHCTNAVKPWQYSDISFAEYDCVNRLITDNWKCTINPTSSTVLPVVEQTWSQVKGLFK